MSRSQFGSRSHLIAASSRRRLQRARVRLFEPVAALRRRSPASASTAAGSLDAAAASRAASQSCARRRWPRAVGAPRRCRQPRVDARRGRRCGFAAVAVPVQARAARAACRRSASAAERPRCCDRIAGRASVRELRAHRRAEKPPAEPRLVPRLGDLRARHCRRRCRPSCHTRRDAATTTMQRAALTRDATLPSALPHRDSDAVEAPKKSERRLVRIVAR